MYAVVGDSPGVRCFGRQSRCTLLVYSVLGDSPGVLCFGRQSRCTLFWETVQVYAVVGDSPGVRCFGRQSRCTLFCANKVTERNDARIPNVRAMADTYKLYAVMLEM